MRACQFIKMVQMLKVDEVSHVLLGKKHNKKIRFKSNYQNGNRVKKYLFKINFLYLNSGKEVYY